MMDRAEMEAAIEAILFVSSEPVPRARLAELFEEEEREQAAEALAAVLARYEGTEARGVMVEDVAGGVRLVTRPETGAWLRRFFEVASGSKLSMAALETLAIVAYRQPITGPEIQELRSVSPAGVLKTLLEKRLVRIAGRKEVVGKPFLYATTREFLVHFGLNSLRDLPPLEEFEETFGASAGSSALGGAEATDAIDATDATGVADAAEGGEGGAGDREERILREAAEVADRDGGHDGSADREGGHGGSADREGGHGGSAEREGGDGGADSAETMGAPAGRELRHGRDTAAGGDGADKAGSTAPSMPSTVDEDDDTEVER